MMKKNAYPAKKPMIDLKNLPPINPSATFSIPQVKYEKPSGKTQSPNSEKHVDPNSIKGTKQRNEINGDNRAVQKTDSRNEGFPHKGFAKSKLHEVCAAYKWDPPVFECIKEEGPGHKRSFTFKVTMKIESSKTILECCGAPQCSKKQAAEHAAEGALWYLKAQGYFPIQKGDNKKVKM